MKFYFNTIFVVVCFGILTMLFAACSQKVETPPSSSKNPAPKTSSSVSTQNQSVVTAPMDYVTGTLRAGQQAQKVAGTVNLQAIQTAIESFQQEEGRNPESLNELVQKSYLKALPAPPPGQKFEYDAKSGSVKFVPES